MEIRRRSRRNRDWLAWAGDLNALERVAKVMSALIEKASNGVTGDGTEGEYLDEVPDLDSRLGHRYVSRRNGVTLTFEEGNDSVDGPVPVVLAEVDRRTVQALGLVGSYRDPTNKGAGSGYTCVVEFAKEAGPHGSQRFYQSGVRLTVSSMDQGWTRQAFAELSEEIEKGVPPWSRFRSGWAVVSYGVAAFVALVLGSWAWLGDKAYGWIFWIAIGVFITAAFFAGRIARSWILPGFELLADGGHSAGSKRIAYWGAVAISIPIGVVVNILTRS